MKIILLFFIAFSCQAANVTIVIGQSNAWGIVQYGSLGTKTHTKIIDCTAPGKGIDYFSVKKSFYKNCIKKAKGHKIKNVVFWQGESDAWDYGLTEAWKHKTLKVLRSLRADVCDNKAKLVIVLMNSNPNLTIWPYWLNIRKQQAQIKARHIDSDNYAFDVHQYPENLMPYPQNLHLTIEGYVNISQAIADEVKGE